MKRQRVSDIQTPASSPFALRGVIEGFYGTYYTFPERRDLIRFLGRQGFNFYLYGPKNDRHHRMRWREPYPRSVMRQFGETICVAQTVGVTFCYAISFGVPMNYASSDDFCTVIDKFKQFYDRGCRSFALLLDDLVEAFADETNRQHFPDVAHAHVYCANRLHQWLTSRPEACSFYVCPTDYYGIPPFSAYLHHLGESLHPAIQVFYTGPDISSRTIRADDAAALAAVLRRKPVIWDNYPVNDLASRREMHLGPLRGRDPGLARVTGGFVSNPMLQAEASKIPLCTIGEYLRDPQRYDPDEAWSRALLQVAGTAHEPLRRFAETSLASCLQAEQAPRMTMLAAEARDALESLDEGRRSRALATLADYCDALDESCYSLKHRMSNLKLRDDILPWIEALEAKLWLARHAVKAARALAANEPSGPSGRAVFNILHEIEREPKSIGGAEVVCFATHVADMILKHEATTDAGSDERTVLPHAPLREDGADT